MWCNNNPCRNRYLDPGVTEDFVSPEICKTFPSDKSLATREEISVFLARVIDCVILCVWICMCGDREISESMRCVVPNIMVTVSCPSRSSLSPSSYVGRIYEKLWCDQLWALFNNPFSGLKVNNASLVLKEIILQSERTYMVQSWWRIFHHECLHPTQVS